MGVLADIPFSRCAEAKRGLWTEGVLCTDAAVLGPGSMKLAVQCHQQQLKAEEEQWERLEQVME